MPNRHFCGEWLGVPVRGVHFTFFRHYHVCAPSTLIICARHSHTKSPPLRCSWLVLPGRPGCFWLLLAAPDCSWLLLAAPGCFWMLPAAHGCFWMLPAAHGCSWLVFLLLMVTADLQKTACLGSCSDILCFSFVSTIYIT
jgi:hypothetical protein